MALNVRFPGQYYDEETGLHYNYLRYYDPSLGRYITSDLNWLIDGISSYAYSKQNPIAYYDPTGEAGIGAVGFPIVEACLGNPACTAAVGGTLSVGFICIVNPDLCLAALSAVCDDLTFGNNPFDPVYNNEEGETTPYGGDTPDDNPGNYKPGEQPGDKINKGDGSIWSPDRAGHGGSKWKRWPDKKSKREGKGRESVRPDGSVR